MVIFRNTASRIGVGLISATVALATFSQSVGATCMQISQHPLDLYGSEIRFDVYRDGRAVGSHTVNFREHDDRLFVETRFDVKVSVLFFTAFRYSYAATEIWQDGCLQSVRAVTDDDGKRSIVQASASASALRGEGPRGEIDAPAGLFPTSHWNARVLQSDRVLNTITGTIDQVSILDLGADMVSVNGRTAPAQRFRYTGDLNVDVWYDDEGRWVKMRFAAKDGSIIEYVCRSCQNADGAA